MLYIFSCTKQLEHCRTKCMACLKDGRAFDYRIQDSEFAHLCSIEYNRILIHIQIFIINY